MKWRPKFKAKRRPIWPTHVHIFWNSNLAFRKETTIFLWGERNKRKVKIKGEHANSCSVKLLYFPLDCRQYNWTPSRNKIILCKRMINSVLFIYLFIHLDEIYFNLQDLLLHLLLLLNLSFLYANNLEHN